jgi:hypothetical protein
VLLDGTVAVIPHETVAKPGDTLYVGVYGVDAKNNLVIPTLWTGIGGVRDAADPSGDPGTDPSLPVWADLQNRVEDLEKRPAGSGIDVFGAAPGQTVKIAAVDDKGRPTAWDPADFPESGGNVDLTGYATEQYVKDYAQPKGEYLTEHQSLEGYATEQFVRDGYQPKGDYLTAVPDDYAKTEDIPTKPEDIGAQPAGNYLTEVPGGYATEEFVTNKIAEAELGGEEVDLSGYAQKSELPTKVSQLENDKGYLTEHQDISGKLNASELPTAINTALAQAKASGEFDGKDGATGQPGKDGQDYVLTDADRTEIAASVLEALPTWKGGSY